MSETLADRIDALLPQTQCTRCGYAGCRPYAEAIAGDAAAINRCPPGGAAVIAALAHLTGREPQPLDPNYGAHGPLRVAVIDEAACIGCTLCIAACPVDAVIGAPKRMHAILPSLCSGCELCIPPCPVDCITLEPAARLWTDQDAAGARVRHRARAQRLARGERIGARTTVAADAATNGTRTAVAVDAATKATRQVTIAAALARARARRGADPRR